MPLSRRLRNRLRSQSGFTTVTLMGVLAVGGLLVAATFSAVDPDIGLSRQDQDSKQAYGAAEAGLQWYLNGLAKDNNYYVKCTAVPAPSTTETAPVNQRWSGLGPDTRKWRRLPGERAEYTVELLPAPGFTGCVEGNQYSMVDPSGNMRVRVTGRSRNEYRTVLATLRRRNFIDFIYFTHFETLDPAAYSNPASAEFNCGRFRDSRAGRGCDEIRFVDADDIRGPMHTNDNALICGSPTFGRTRRDAIEINGPKPFVKDAGCGGNADVKGTLVHPAGTLGMPPSNGALRTIADISYRFTGMTLIELSGSQMLVRNKARFGNLDINDSDQDGDGTLKLVGNAVAMPLPPNGVLYASNALAGCTAGYDRDQDYRSLPIGCGDIWLKGSHLQDLTIAADNDIVIHGPVTRGNDGLLLGLIANNFVRVYHPVSSDCDDDLTGTLENLKIQAAILALQHSFLVDNWRCGDDLGDLTVDGAIAQKYRGPVGTGSGGNVSTGYSKDYIYNDRLRYREPPYFLDPEQAAWRIARQSEQARAVHAR
jgi:type II secretory pathway pseudopilin PulG